MQPPSINSAVSALRFLFTVTLDRPDLARRLTVVRQPRRLPLSVEEVTLLLQAAPRPACTDVWWQNFGRPARTDVWWRCSKPKSRGIIAARGKIALAGPFLLNFSPVIGAESPRKR
jgi:hypothetical protein